MFLPGESQGRGSLVGFIKAAQRFLEDMLFNLRPDVDIFVVDSTQAFRQRFRAEGDRKRIGFIPESFPGRAYRARAPVLSVYKKGKGSSGDAPPCGASPKKLLNRSRNFRFSAFVGSWFRRSASCCALSACAALSASMAAFLAS